jgi:hypothetical protein
MHRAACYKAAVAEQPTIRSQKMKVSVKMYSLLHAIPTPTPPRPNPVPAFQNPQTKNPAQNL